MLPFDFTVAGVPVAAATKNKKRRRLWKQAVAAAAKANWSGTNDPLARELSVTIIYFHAGETDIDVDNIAKLILDGMIGIVYQDDRVVSQVTLRRTELVPGRAVVRPSRALAAALVTGLDFVYVKVDEAPSHGEIP